MDLDTQSVDPQAQDQILGDDLGDEEGDVFAGEQPGGESEGDPPSPDPEVWTKAAALDERKKRQEIEERLHAANERLARLEGQAQAFTQAKKDTGPNLDDLIDYSDLSTSIPRAVQLLVNKQVEKERAEAQQAKVAEWQLRLSVSEEYAKERHEDYDDIVPTWNARVNQDPQLLRRMMAAPDPAEYAYRWVKRQNTSKDAATLQKRIAELEAQLQNGTTKKRPSNAGATGGGAKPRATGPEVGILDDATEGR